MKKSFLPLFFISLMVVGCTHEYYVPNVQNVPLFREKNEFRISAHYGGGEESVSGELQTAYSVSDKMAVAMNYIHASGANNSDSDYGKGNYVEGAVGYYKTTSDIGVFEVYGGLGVGGQHHGYSYSDYNDMYGSTVTSGTADLSFLRLYVQPSYGFTLNWLDIAFSTRLNRVSYFSTDIHGSYDSSVMEDIQLLSSKGHYFIEPAITLRAGWKNIKGQIQYVYSGYLNNPKVYFFEQSHLSIGLSIAIADRYKKEKGKE